MNILNQKITDSKELEFAIFCIEQAAKWSSSALKGVNEYECEPCFITKEICPCGCLFC
ncbi:MAG: hypothetical protein KH452_09590 [Clostridiales bacterium]|nr:hypothetical protein [Clostridiales bacterium]